MTIKQWKTVADEITRETEQRIRRREPHAREDAIISAVKKHRLLLVVLKPGDTIGLIEEKGSKWALFVCPSRDLHRILVYGTKEPDDRNWTPEALQRAYYEAYLKTRYGYTI